MQSFKDGFEKVAFGPVKSGTEFVKNIARKRAAHAVTSARGAAAPAGEVLNYSKLRADKSAMDFAQRQRAWRYTPGGQRITVERYPSFQEKLKTRIPETRRPLLSE